MRTEKSLPRDGGGYNRKGKGVNRTVLAVPGQGTCQPWRAGTMSQAMTVTSEPAMVMV